ncbi:4-hydroxythreonine-4-phosphate dehydrogenase [Thermodesulfatator indicus DSM 15286]|uniref:4-hydroxythreonine-4-phosphate dehydrogenase n=1 Tax=Thermodesulfatator indicus (strain DSM 15286 / JCM 11887 / CIR29812) TaxID=667014 RepID=F8ABG4_THEID|nr:4-hydroxythreonine-4-phosphate dehydrogenase PdxA [Thermodesulfatator indicus]AEH44477.1 4-hydroxythreonine-4-phosphate dehydrogenase [Thermodesulfatator indicus DSM 15286]
MPKVKLGVTMGCPAGVGPEICLKALAKSWPEDLELFILGDKVILNEVARRLRLPYPNKNQIISLSSLDEYTPGKPNLETAKAMVRYIKEGLKMCLNGELNGLVTCPISKTALKLAGEPYPGHTEMLAALTNTKEYAMAFYGEKLKIVLVTIHEPLSKVPELLSIEAILKVTRLAYNFLREDLAIKNPRLAIAALNPHAGEGGLFGDEEARILEPAVKKAKEEGLPLSGPYPADSLFYRAINGHFDLVVSLYHDQGLIPFKLLHFEDGVNLTLGLPIVRTSVDHGTAYDIAGKGLAKEDSLVAAIKLSYRMAKNRIAQ